MNNLFWLILAFVVGCGIAAAATQELLWDRDHWKQAWLYLLASGLFVLVFEAIVIWFS
jgi:hypothetical protein